MSATQPLAVVVVAAAATDVVMLAMSVGQLLRLRPLHALRTGVVAAGVAVVGLAAAWVLGSGPGYAESLLASLPR